MTAELRQSADAWRDRDEFRKTVRDWASRIRVSPSEVRLQGMRRKWASCSSAGVLTFSLDLLTEDRTFGEAVIVHELLHLKVRNHGQLFQSLIKSFLGQHAHLAVLTEDREPSSERG
jgi:predicted metal-dependent hydrolase